MMEDGVTGAGPPRAPFVSSAQPLTLKEQSKTMLDVHAPHQTVHTWKDFSVHIAAITIGLLLAVALEKAVEFFHHRQQAAEGLALLKQELNHNGELLRINMNIGALVEDQHYADLAVLRRLRAGASRPDDQLIFVRPYEGLGSSAWKIVHESDAAAFMRFDLLAQYGEIYQAQQLINEATQTSYVELQKYMSVLNTDLERQNHDEEDKIERAALRSGGAPRTAEEIAATNARLSGKHDLSRLTSAQVDRLEEGFQQAISAERRQRRLYVYLDGLYAKMGN
jgi:hypothetical protein